MEEKKYLSEENYQRARKKIKRISLIILIVGLIIGGGLILTGVIKQNNAKKTNEQRASEAYKESESKVEEAKKELSEIDTQKKELESKLKQKEYECDSIEMNGTDWFANVSKCESEVSELQSQINDLEMKEFNLNNANYKVYYSKVSSMKYVIFYILGASIIGFSGMISLTFYIIAKRREIAAFTAQQVMPIAKEGIDAIAPTIGNAAGEIARGIASGIRESNTNRDGNFCPNCGNKIDDNAKFCGKCGKEIKKL